MHRKNSFRAILVVILGLSVVGLMLAVPAVGHADEADDARASASKRLDPRMRATKTRSPEGGSPHVLLRMLRQLDLDESQKERIRAVVGAARDEGEPLREELRESMVSLRSLFEDESGGEAELMEAIDAVLAARQALGDHRRGVKEQVREVLTPRQQAQLVLIAERGRKGPRGGLGHPGRRGFGPR